MAYADFIPVVSGGGRALFRESEIPHLFEIEGQRINITSIEEAVTRIVTRLQRPESFLVFTLNLDHLVKLRSNKRFCDAYRNAEFVTADGFPLVTLARRDGISIKRTTGSDLIEPVCCAAAANGLPIFLFGTTLPTLCTAASRLTTRIKGLEISGVFSPPSGFETSSDLAEEAVRIIAESGARVCFVALSPPKQEIFAATAMKHAPGVAFIAIGAGLDFIAGTQLRSPALLCQLNLEWAWRLATNPRRLGLRYVRCAILFAELLWRRILGKNLALPKGVRVA